MKHTLTYSRGSCPSPVLLADVDRELFVNAVLGLFDAVLGLLWVDACLQQASACQEGWEAEVSQLRLQKARFRASEAFGGMVSLYQISQQPVDAACMFAWAHLLGMLNGECVCRGG